MVVVVRIYVVIKHHDQKQLWQESVYFSLQFHIIVRHFIKESQGRNLRQEPGGRNWCGGPEE